MSHNLANQDFGSDEEDDDFNPAPAEDSDNEDVKVGGSKKVAMGEDDAEKMGK